MSDREAFDIVCRRLWVEIQRNRARVSNGELPWCMQDTDPHDYEKLAVLTEEAGEVAKAVQPRHKGTRDGRLGSELADVATASVAWLMAREVSRRACNV